VHGTQFIAAHPVALDRTRLWPIDHNIDKPAVALATDVDATTRPRQDDRGGSRKGSKGNAVRALAQCRGCPRNCKRRAFDQKEPLRTARVLGKVVGGDDP